MSATCLIVPTFAHAAAGGGLPMQASLIVYIALLSVSCVALADRRRSGIEIALMLAATQPVFHVLLALGSHHGADAIVPSAPMVAAHILAIAALAALLSGAESVAWTLATLSDTILLVRANRLAFSARTEPWPLAQAVWPRMSDRLGKVFDVLSSAPLRGPPALV
jgi:hypothetical protein